MHVNRLFKVAGCLGVPLWLAACATQEDSLRIGTFNAQLLPSTFSGQLPGDDVSRPPRICTRIMESGYDIIALNEVFDEDSRELFVNSLSGTYPHYVEYLGDDAVGSEDSGLMLFSKFPFMPLSLRGFVAESDDLDAQSAGADWKDVAFIEYDESSGSDDWAAKGAALVRVKNPHTGRIYNIVFTHMQASYPEDEVIGLCPDPVWSGGQPPIDLREPARESWREAIRIRRAQLRDIQRLIEGSLTGLERQREEIFVLGDLNVDGDRADTNLGNTGWCQPNLFEWNERFNTPGEFTTDSVKDAWTTEHPPKDRGLTNLYHWALKQDDDHCADFEPETGGRLDYFLRNRVGDGQRRFVVQHMTRAFNLRDGAPMLEGGLGVGGVNDLSDHIGLNADMNRWAPHCNPLEANANPALDAILAGTITHPGSMQWMRFDAPGTYAFALPTEWTDYRVYSPTDLSVPVPQYFDETTTITLKFPRKPDVQIVGKKFHVPDPPLFVRVFKPFRTTVGDYQFVAHRNTCSSMNDACVIRANEPINHSLPPAPINADDTSWFELHLQRADSGVAQDLIFFAEGFAEEDFEIELRGGDGVTVLDGSSTTVASPMGGRRVEMRRTEVGPGRMFLLVKRKNLAVTSFRVGWETNLTVLHGIQAGVAGAATVNVYCHEETDTVGIDEIYLTVISDGVTVVNDVYIGDFDDAVQRSLEDLIPRIRYVESVLIRLRDDDDGGNFGDDIMEEVIPVLPREETQRLVETRGLACCGGSYTVRFNRSRSLPIAVP